MNMKFVFFTALGSTLLCENVSFRTLVDPEVLVAGSQEALVQARQKKKLSQHENGFSHAA